MAYTTILPKSVHVCRHSESNLLTLCDSRMVLGVCCLVNVTRARVAFTRTEWCLFDYPNRHYYANLWQLIPPLLANITKSPPAEVPPQYAKHPHLSKLWSKNEHTWYLTANRTHILILFIYIRRHAFRSHSLISSLATQWSAHGLCSSFSNIPLLNVHIHIHSHEREVLFCSS